MDGLLKCNHVQVCTFDQNQATFSVFHKPCHGQRIIQVLSERLRLPTSLFPYLWLFCRILNLTSQFDFLVTDTKLSLIFFSISIYSVSKQGSDTGCLKTIICSLFFQYHINQPATSHTAVKSSSTFFPPTQKMQSFGLYFFLFCWMAEFCAQLDPRCQLELAVQAKGSWMQVFGLKNSYFAQIFSGAAAVQRNASISKIILGGNIMVLWPTEYVI